MEVKELPLASEVSTGSVPVYDSTTDSNYTVAINKAMCRYWSTVEEKWLSDGCKVSSVVLLTLTGIYFMPVCHIVVLHTQTQTLTRILA